MPDPKSNAKSKSEAEFRADMDEEVDETSDESFPASDPPSWTMGRSHPIAEHKRGEPGSPPSPKE
jgi:hypothetical protein